MFLSWGCIVHFIQQLGVDIFGHSRYVNLGCHPVVSVLLHKNSVPRAVFMMKSLPQFECFDIVSLSKFDKCEIRNW